MAPKDTPSADRDIGERGLHAKHGDDPTLASYLSSLLYVLSFPMLVVLAYGGHWAGYYPYSAILWVFGGSLLLLVALAFLVMHFGTAGR
ncbi:MAG TPA: hypothetical protein VJ898_12530 [Natrialbaceae archaeon]|nr:hypothetical protein [Natrialbaceae archaeon]